MWTSSVATLQGVKGHRGLPPCQFPWRTTTCVGRGAGTLQPALRHTVFVQSLLAFKLTFARINIKKRCPMFSVGHSDILLEGDSWVGAWTVPGDWFPSLSSRCWMSRRRRKSRMRGALSIVCCLARPPNWGCHDPHHRRRLRSCRRWRLGEGLIDFLRSKHRYWKHKDNCMGFWDFMILW